MITPWFASNVFLLRHILPVAAFDKINQWLGNFDTVKDVVGRGNKDQLKNMTH